MKEKYNINRERINQEVNAYLKLKSHPSSSHLKYPRYNLIQYFVVQCWYCLIDLFSLNNYFLLRPEIILHERKPYVQFKTSLQFTRTYLKMTCKYQIFNDGPWDLSGCPGGTTQSTITTHEVPGCRSEE